jgi:hypothetical protein
MQANIIIAVIIVILTVARKSNLPRNPYISAGKGFEICGRKRLIAKGI